MSDGHVTRRTFLKKASAVSAGVAVALEGSARGVALPFVGRKEGVPVLPNARDLPNGGKPIKLFTGDLNWITPKGPRVVMTPAQAQEWAYVDADEYFAWHLDLGVNIFYMLGYSVDGYAYYPTKLGPWAPGPGSQLFPKLFKLAEKKGLPFSSFFSTGQDFTLSNLRYDWTVPTSRDYGYLGLMAPESPWVDLLCARITEFLRLYPVQWLNIDCFNYGKYDCNDFRVQPSPFVKGPFKEIVGREMPEKASEITFEESMKYKREIMARLFYRVREAMHKGNPETKANFNVPFWRPAEPMWVNHPMLNECDQLVAESSDEAVVRWLLKIRKPHQRVMTTIIGRPAEKGVCDPNTWKKWYEAGCDFFAYAHGTPPDFRPHPSLHDQVEIVRQAYHLMP
jgi:hypothetical protein